MTNNNAHAQKNMRKEKRAQRKALSESDKIRKNQQISQQLLANEDYQTAKIIGAYLCMPEEVDVRAIIDDAWAVDKLVYLPVVIALGEPLKFARYTPKTELIKDCLDISIPNVRSTEYISAEELDVVVTPLVAFDEKCNRIGMGGGFYDRTFAFKANKQANHKANTKKLSTLLGVAFDTQLVPTGIVANQWDICPDMIITESTIYCP